MNPPSALFGAMNRERKPFTYTPGGLDLSEIKSERMAQRLMRNAMNQGVPETPASSLKSPQLPGVATVIPNFNCLPVQVFPSFQLPANPKSLLRTRSNPDGSNDISNKAYKHHTTINNIDKNINKVNVNHSLNSKNSFSNSNVDCKVSANNYSTLPKAYDVENRDYAFIPNVEPASYGNNKTNNYAINSFDLNKPKTIQQDAKEEFDDDFSKNMNIDTTINNSKEDNILKLNDIKEETTENAKKQEEISVNKSSSKTENNVQNQNGDTETAVVVKLPSKKSAAKTETNVEVTQKTLPDGSVQEIKTTTTKTTIDGKTEISTRTETKTISKEETDEETYEEEEEEEFEDENKNHIESKQTCVTTESVTKNTEVKVSNGISQNYTTENEKVEEKQSIKENGGIIKQEENIETSTTKKVVVIQSEVQDSEEEAEEIEEEIEEEEEGEDVDQNAEEVIVIKKQNITKSESNDVQNEEDELEEPSKTKENTTQENEDSDDNEEEEEEEQCDEKDNKIGENQKEDEETNLIEENNASDKENENIDSKIESDKKDQINVNENQNDERNKEDDENNDKEKIKKYLLEKETDKTESDIKSDEIIIPIQTDSDVNKEKSDNSNVIQNEKLSDENKHVLREPSIPLEKVEEVEIKPIGTPAQEIITKSHKEIITTTTDKPLGAHSTQTQYNVIENIVTVNRTTKTLDHAYEQAGEYTIPVVKTTVVPESSGIIPPAPVFNRTYQSNYSKDPTTERRHSLLLERLSVERQLPPSLYQTDNTYNNLSYDGRQFSNEPQSEIIIESNVKPSMVNKNQQWYSRKDSYDNTTQTGMIQPSHQWNQQPQTQPQPPPQQQSYPQPPYQPQEQPQYKFTSQNQSYNQTNNYQTQYTPQPQPPPTFTETYKPSIDSYNQSSYPSYAPKPSWVSSTVDPKPNSISQSNQYSFESETLQKSTHNQSSYVPPPWEQDTIYNINFNQTSYQSQPIPTTPTIKPTSSWKPPNNNLSKTKPTSYIPPAPNQSFVKHVSVVDPPKMPGRKTYYSEYERRYITVPESTYIPTETKYQPQPDPSPKYYYDQNEPVETVEPQWRKELREFTEKTQTSSQTVETSVRPPWEEEPKYVTSSELSNTQTWSQTLRPRSYRERSVESEYTSTAKEWSKSNSLGRGRPHSSYINNLKRIPERPRGVSVDRYNPNMYQSPLSGEHPPVQSQTLDPTIHPKPHYNPNVPAYHNRASAEPREQPVYNQSRGWGDSRTPPVQSRSFKYLQWITGTED